MQSFAWHNKEITANSHTPFICQEPQQWIQQAKKTNKITQALASKKSLHPKLLQIPRPENSVTNSN